VTVSYYGRVLEDKVQWLAEMVKCGAGIKLRTFMDEGFVWAFHDHTRFIADGDLFDTDANGSITTTRMHDDYTESEAGYFTVQIGNRAFTCLRVVTLEGPVADEDTTVTEAYITDTGRMALMRHYCRPATAARFGETVNEGLTVIVDGHSFCHFRDTLTDTGCGIDLR
jgi:hypothetical protein